MTTNEGERPVPESLTVPDVIAAVFRGYSTFARTYLVAPNPPALLIMIWLIGMDAVAGTIEMEYVMRGAYLVDNWFYAWLRIMAGGLLVGVIRYWLVGTLFHGVVLIAGGHGLPRTSRYIFLYSAIPVAVVDLALKVVQMIVYGNAYFRAQTSALLDAVIGGVMLGTWIFAARLLYIGMRELMHADRKRSIILIVAVSATIMAVMFSAAI